MTRDEINREKDIRRHLKRELRRRSRVNPRYSLRAFASSLKIHPSTLSRILRGFQPITLSTLAKISERLELNPFDLEEFKKDFLEKKIHRKKIMATRQPRRRTR